MCIGQGSEKTSNTHDQKGKWDELANQGMDVYLVRVSCAEASNPESRCQFPDGRIEAKWRKTCISTSVIHLEDDDRCHQLNQQLLHCLWNL